MQFSIEGNYPVLRCILNRGETIKTSAGAMSWMSDGFDLEVKSGGLRRGIARTN
ncbi:MAG: AIM24 family protein [Tissierellia bacterium]|nr:AIM24 family protein [Tissierellia bacterium]